MKKNKVSAKNIDLHTFIRHFLGEIGEDVNRDGIKQTPERFEAAVKSILSGYDRSFEAENKFFDNRPHFDGMIFFKNIDFFSICEHHLLPFFGYAHIAYIPAEKQYLGISKLARAVDIYARRLQDQETLGSQIAEVLMKEGKAKGVAVLLEGKHMCNVARGIEKKMTVMSTIAFYGDFKKNQELQNKFMLLIQDRAKV